MSRTRLAIAALGLAVTMLAIGPVLAILHAQTSGFVLVDATPPTAEQMKSAINKIACYGYDGSASAVFDGTTPPIGYRNFDPRTVLQNTLPNDGVILNYMTRQMHLVEKAQQWHGFVWMDADRDGSFAWELVTYPSALCSYYPDPAREAIEGHYWIDAVH